MWYITTQYPHVATVMMWLHLRLLLPSRRRHRRRRRPAARHVHPIPSESPSVTAATLTPRRLVGFHFRRAGDTTEAGRAMRDSTAPQKRISSSSFSFVGAAAVGVLGPGLRLRQHDGPQACSCNQMLEPRKACRFFLFFAMEENPNKLESHPPPRLRKAASSPSTGCDIRGARLVN